MRYILYMLVISMTYVVSVKAEDIAKPNSTSWWLKSPLDHPELLDKTLYHVEGSYSFTNMTGNIEGDIHKVKLLNFLRYDYFTMHFNFVIDKYNITTFEDNSGKSESENKVSSDLQIAEFALDYDLSKHFNIETGVIWEKDMKQSVLDRWSYYAGFGFNHHFLNNHFLDFTIAGGMVELDYGLPREILDMFDVQKDPDAYLFFLQSYSWAITKNIMFKEKFHYFPNITESKRFRYSLDVALLFSVWDFLSIMIEHNRRFDNDAKNIYTFTTDTKTLVGIQLQY